MPKVIGLDLSVSCTGVAGNGWATIIPTPAYTKKKNQDPVQEECKRLANHHDRIYKIMTTLVDQYFFEIDLVVMEGLAFDSKDFDRQNAGLAWIVRHHLHRTGIPYALVPPSNVKMYATGSGAADKRQVLQAVESWFPGLTANFPKRQKDNAADAMVLAAMGYDRLCHPLESVKPLRRQEALGKGFWPLLPSDEDCLALAA